MTSIARIRTSRSSSSRRSMIAGTASLGSGIPDSIIESMTPNRTPSAGSSVRALIRADDLPSTSKCGLGLPAVCGNDRRYHRIRFFLPRIVIATAKVALARCSASCRIALSCERRGSPRLVVLTPVGSCLLCSIGGWDRVRMWVLESGIPWQSRLCEPRNARLGEARRRGRHTESV